LAVMVIAAGYYRFSDNREIYPVTSDTLPIEEKKAETTSTEKTSQDKDYFARARYERDCARSETVEILSVSSVSNEDAENLKEKIAEHEKNAGNETAIENSVKTKGYEDCVAFVDETGVKVIVKASKLDAEGVEAIKNIIIGQTGASPTEIKISSKE